MPRNRPAVLRRKISKINHTLIKQLTTLGSIADGLADDMPLTLDAGWRNGPLDHSKKPPTKSGYRFYLFNLFRHSPFFRRRIAGFFATTPGASSSNIKKKESNPGHLYALRPGAGNPPGLEANTMAWHKYADGPFSDRFHPCTVIASAGHRSEISYDLQTT